MATSKPNLTRVWASGAPGGNIEDPDVTSPNKFQDGWVAEIPPFENFNFLQQLFTQGLAHANDFGLMQWDLDTDYPISGWARSTVDGEVYVSLVTPNTNNEPSVSPIEWGKLSVKGMATNVLTVSASGNYDKPPNLIFAIIECIAGGGGGGGASSTIVGEVAAAIGGSGGGYAKLTVANSALLASEAIVIGTGGSGGVGNSSGINGTDSTFGTHITCTGGIGGPSGLATTGNGILPGISGSNSVGGDINIKGGPSGSRGNIVGSRMTLSAGGDTPFGYGGFESDGNGANGDGNGSGGAGASNPPSATSKTGGQGADGLIIITEFLAL